MNSAARKQVGLQAVLNGGLVLLALGLTWGLVATAFHRFEDMAQESARIIFGQAAREGNGKVAELVARASRLVDVQSQTQFEAALQPQSPLQQALERHLLAELRNDGQLYSSFVGLDNGDFFQAIALRGEARLVRALNVPPATHYALRLITAEAPGAARTEHWRYLDERGQPIDERRQPAAFDPRERTWYRSSIGQAARTLSEPYLFASTGQLGLTVAQRLAQGGGVVGADLDLADLDRFFAGLASTPRSVTLLVDPANRLVAWGGGPEAGLGAGVAPLKALAETGNPQLAYLAQWPAGEDGAAVRLATIAGEPHVIAQSRLLLAPSEPYRVAAYAPLSEFAGFIFAARDQMLLFALLFLAVVLPLAIYGSGRVVHGLKALAQDARRIRGMDLSDVPPIRSRLREIDELGESQAAMRQSIRSGTEALRSSQQQLEHLIATGLEMSRERDRMALLRRILVAATELTHCDAGTLYVVTEQRTLRFALRTRDDALPSFEIPLRDENGAENLRFVSVYAALRNETVAIDDVYAETRFDLSGTRSFDAASGYRTVSMLAVPLAPREGEVIGVLQLMNAKDRASGAIVPFGADALRFVSALAAQAAVALDNHQLAEAHQTLMDALVKLVAGAIDAKSAYTGGHCERVPELALMLAEAAHAESSGPLADFAFRSADEWREFRIGAWLHDCGKVTTPEYVVDKATKLETIHDRIHEVRTRFEVLLRDAHIECLQAQLRGEEAAAAGRTLAARQRQLAEDFAFVAECNLGGEFMAPQHVQRLREIGSQRWLRHFDDRLGIGHLQVQRLAAHPAAPLPAAETLLADKPEHIVPRPPEKALDPRHGFRVEVPANLQNLGELYNLSVGRGTLTEEERFKINEHIIQTIVMLDALPLPKNMRRIPEYAGTHHETLAGTGYPRRLKAGQLSVPARIMAIADIFEALTAADRPYKKAKTLSESVAILARFRDDGHIDPDLFALFLRSGIYRRYAERFLQPEQIDAVEVEACLAAATAEKVGAG